MTKKLSIFLIGISLSLFLFNNLLDKDDQGIVELEIAPYPDKIVELISLYFADDSNTFLVKETRVIERTVQLKEELILRELMRGPFERNLSSTLPPHIHLYSIHTIKGTAYINFSKEFITRFRPSIDNEITTVYSIVNSLTELSYIDRVQILVEGEPISLYGSKLDLKEPLERNNRIIHQPFPGAIEIVRMYFSAIERQEYKKVYDLSYKAEGFDVDYLTFYRHMIKTYAETKNFNVISYRVSPGESGESTVWVDYNEENIRGEIIEHRDHLFMLRSVQGEWRIVMNF